MSSLEDLRKVGGFDELTRDSATLRAHPRLIMDIIETDDNSPDSSFDPERAHNEAMREIVGSARDDATREFDNCVSIITHIDQLLRIAFAQGCVRFARAYTHERKPVTLESLGECAKAIIACVNSLVMDEPFASTTITHQSDDSERPIMQIPKKASVREHKVAIALNVTREEAQIARDREYVQKITRALMNARDQIDALVEMNKRTMIA